MPGRILAIDYGEVRVGLAISDPLAMIATGLHNLDARKFNREEILQQVKDICDQYEVVKIVVGLPKRTDGREGEKELAARQFAEELREVTGLEIVLWDERFTSRLAQQIMRETGVRKDKRKFLVDRIAAEIILQEYLNQL